MLLKFRSDPNKPDHFKRTPLFIASQNGNLSIVKLLLAHKAIPGTKTLSGYSCLDTCDQRSEEAAKDLNQTFKEIKQLQSDLISLEGTSSLTLRLEGKDKEEEQAKLREQETTTRELYA